MRTQQSLRVYFGTNKLIAKHARVERGFVTSPSHMPKNHQEHGKWTRERIEQWARRIGDEVLEWVNTQLSSRKHPALAYRLCLGVLNLDRNYPGRLNDACRVANSNGLTTLKQIRQVLRNNTDKRPLFEQEEQEETELPQDHENIRGPGEYE